MDERLRLLIVGAGPGGLSAAAHAARLGLSHRLLEAAPAIAETVRRYQKGKWVMAEPATLPLRSSIGFLPGPRERVLEHWQREVDAAQIELRLNASVQSLTGRRGDFRVTLSSGETLLAEAVVLAMGVQGNRRQLEVPGASLAGVQYQLDDADEYADETIVVIGGGDAGVENALALAPRNRVVLVNRQLEFPNCREANLTRLTAALAGDRPGALSTRVGCTVLRVEAQPGCTLPYALVLQTPQGVERIECHRIIARLGATPPRQMLERFGVRFTGDDPAAMPQLSERYESSVPGLYLIGSLAGYPLIKQAMNQGYEVVESILGHPVEPADQPLLSEKFGRIPSLFSVAAGLDLLRVQPLLRSLNTLRLREFALDSAMLAPSPGEVVFRKNDYGNSFYSVLRGSVQVHVVGKDGSTALFPLNAGDFFGEMGLLSGRRRSATVVAGDDCVLAETPRRSMLRLLDAEPGVQRRLDEVALQRLLRNGFGGALTTLDVDFLVATARLRQYGVGEVIFHEGDVADAFYLIRRGSVTISLQYKGKEVVLAYLAAGSYFGEMALVSKIPRTATIRAAAPTEVVLIEAERFNDVLYRNPGMRSEVAARYLDGVRSGERLDAGKNCELVRFLVEQGIGEATDILVIDYARCIRCNLCEAACADVHGGVQRLNREAGQTFERFHVPASCRHCEYPRCMGDCPADALHRSISGEVYITDRCIGCGNCQRNCPYGVIRMAATPESPTPRRWSWLFGMSAAPPRAAPGGAPEKAVKCDLCMGIIGGHACVRACPTGAARRVGPEQSVALCDGR